MKSYRELPAYIAGWNVAMMPFALNEATRFISPTKVPEYLAAGRPVVSTPVPDVVRWRHEDGVIDIAAGPDAFVRSLERALVPPSAAWLKRVDERLRKMSWESTWRDMNLLLEGALSRNAASDTGTVPASA